MPNNAASPRIEFVNQHDIDDKELSDPPSELNHNICGSSFNSPSSSPQSPTSSALVMPLSSPSASPSPSPLSSALFNDSSLHETAAAIIFPITPAATSSSFALATVTMTSTAITTDLDSMSRANSDTPPLTIFYKTLDFLIKIVNLIHVCALLIGSLSHIFRTSKKWYAQVMHSIHAAFADKQINKGVPLRNHARKIFWPLLGWHEVIQALEGLFKFDFFEKFYNPKFKRATVKLSTIEKTRKIEDSKEKPGLINNLNPALIFDSVREHFKNGKKFLSPSAEKYSAWYIFLKMISVVTITALVVALIIMYTVKIGKLLIQTKKTINTGWQNPLEIWQLLNTELGKGIKFKEKVFFILSKLTNISYVYFRFSFVITKLNALNPLFKEAQRLPAYIVRHNKLIDILVQRQRELTIEEAEELSKLREPYKNWFEEHHPDTTIKKILLVSKRSVYESYRLSRAINALYKFILFILNNTQHYGDASEVICPLINPMPAYNLKTAADNLVAASKKIYNYCEFPYETFDSLSVLWFEPRPEIRSTARKSYKKLRGNIITSKGYQNFHTAYSGEVDMLLSILPEASRTPEPITEDHFQEALKNDPDFMTYVECDIEHRTGPS